MAMGALVFQAVFSIMTEIVAKKVLSRRSGRGRQVDAG